ncbi:hypothetical protein BFJ72_g14718 [Fusarium proliferatum]|uniref:FMN hydroxy acid dehydrogenase domain-containing protein n=1 Tax=Gibberella intermedia TaxID=948311 RepID=A0A420RZ37_GIBIN|nr:hypothetical protein BFJ72_g14718 [Fusarium proliferatum]
MAPIGVQDAYHQDKETDLAAACAELGVPLTINTATSSSIEEIATAGRPQAPRWFQLYWPRDSDITVSLLRRAREVGCGVLVVTLDTFTMAWRPLDLDLGFLPFPLGQGNAIGFSDPVFRRKFAERTAGGTTEDKVVEASAQWIADVFSGVAHSWEDLTFLREHWDGSITHLITGGSGFIAIHLVNQLLGAGYVVHATVRSLNNVPKTQPLRRLQEKYPGKLELFEADLLKPGSFESAMQGCSVVHHVASPFLMAEKIRDGQQEMVEPALHGTRNVLNSVNGTESVKKVVLTSTIGSIFGDYIDVRSMKDNILYESYFNESSSATHNPYHYSNVLAEKEAWKIQKAQSRWNMVVICPGLVLGPSLTAGSDSGSLFLLDELFSGQLWFGVPDVNFCTVDVREIATAHIRAAENQSASGRYIVTDKEMTSFIDISKLVRPLAKRPWTLPGHILPTLLVRILGPFFGLSQKWMRANLGIRFSVDNERSIKELGVLYRPLAETLDDHYKSWVAQNGK